MGATEQDPFAIFHTPPPNESAGERAAREAKELEAKRVSDMIDDQIKADKAALKKQKNLVRVLLLGQSESGKSTTLKNFRMRYSRTAWESERASWRSVIQLNVIRSIITIVETLQAEMDGDPIDFGDVPDTPSTPLTGLPAFTTSVDSPTTASAPDAFHYDGVSAPGASPSVVASFAVHRPISRTTQPSSPAAVSRSNSLTRGGPLSSLLTGKHQLLKLRLGPLRRVETDLRKRLGEGAVEEHEGIAANLSLGPLSLEPETNHLVRRQRSEFSVHRLSEALEKSKHPNSRNGSHRGHGASDDEASAPGSPGGVDEATEIIATCQEDMKALWSDDAVRVVLKKRKIRMEETAGFFLDDLDRIARRDYQPSDDDVVRARLRTVGVQEYRIKFDANTTSVFDRGVGGEAGKEWLLYDVGGSRTARHAWVPFFDNIQAIIFLAPVSCFDERLTEDSKVNRLEDSFLLWRTVCSSKLLAKATIILFLNKCDLLRKKLKTGVQVKKYLPSYGDRPNDAGSVVKYLREKFKEILKANSPEQRSRYFYATTVIDTKATHATIKAVKDSILRDYLKSAEVL